MEELEALAHRTASEFNAIYTGTKGTQDLIYTTVIPVGGTAGFPGPLSNGVYEVYALENPIATYARVIKNGAFISITIEDNSIVTGTFGTTSSINIDNSLNIQNNHNIQYTFIVRRKKNSNYTP